MANSMDVIRPFAEWVEAHSADIQLMGGIGSAALADIDTVIDVNAREVIVPDGFELPTQRNNGTLRDLDVLVKSSSRDDIGFVEAAVAETVGEDLEHSVFGFKSADALQRRIDNPLGFVAFKTFLSDRYEYSDGMVKSLVPFSVPVDPDSLETWSLVTKDMRIPIPHPAMSAINYTNRSISGIRPKDRAKLAIVIESSFAKVPQLKEWAIDGPGREQAILGYLLRSLTPRKDHSDPLGMGMGVPLTPQQLIEQSAFMYPELDKVVQRTVLGMAMFKASGLSLFESNATIVSLWQSHGESHLDSVVKNN